jgi:hypothetical protein
MLLRTLPLAALLIVVLSTSTATQNASSILAASSKAMGVDTLNSITYSGTARNGAFGQSKAIGDPMGAVNVTRVTEYTRTINFAPGGDAAALVSRASGPTPGRRHGASSREQRPITPRYGSRAGSSSCRSLHPISSHRPGRPTA